MTLCDGAIYCSPMGGVIVRCDARDGRMEWMQRYGSRQRTRRVNGLGSAPIIVDDLVICLPRDTDDVIGLSRETGRILWRNRIVLPIKTLGIAGDTLIVHGKWALAALDLQTGNVRWFTPLPRGSAGQVVRLKSSIYVRTQTELRRFDANSGIELEVRPCPKTDNQVSNFAIHGDRLYLLTNEPCSVDSYRPGNRSIRKRPRPRDRCDYRCNRVGRFADTSPNCSCPRKGPCRKTVPCFTRARSSNA